VRSTPEQPYRQLVTGAGDELSREVGRSRDTPTRLPRSPRNGRHSPAGLTGAEDGQHEQYAWLAVAMRPDGRVARRGRMHARRSRRRRQAGRACPPGLDGSTRRFDHESSRGVRVRPRLPGDVVVDRQPGWTAQPCPAHPGGRRAAARGTQPGRERGEGVPPAHPGATSGERQRGLRHRTHRRQRRLHRNREHDDADRAVRGSLRAGHRYPRTWIAEGSHPGSEHPRRQPTVADRQRPYGRT
jgi:hypothetical protein